MKNYQLTIILIATVLIVSCISQYRYESHGSVELSTGQTAEAVLYWFGDEGRLWYGKKYQKTDSDLEMRICGVTPKSFVPDEQTQALQLLSKSGDMMVVSIDEQGKLSNLEAPVRVPADSPCGKILLSGSGAKITDLAEGANPAVIFLCKSTKNPDRYPNASIYQFQAVTKTKNDKREAAIACQ